ncbi:RNA-directed DNA polymerase, eukaryota, nucleotide-binding alpha-beta plait domain protein [Tanacetum coccineum]
MAARARSNVDHTRLISKSIFVKNFPDNTTSKDLWEVCKGYGTVVDVFIPDRKSKAGKRFAFVRFIKVDNVDRLVGNLCTLWIGRMHLHANITRFDRPPIHSSWPNISTRLAANGASSFASVLKGVMDDANWEDDPCRVKEEFRLHFVIAESDLQRIAFGGVRDEEVVVGESVVVTSSSLDMLTNNCLGGIMVSLIFLEGLEEEALEEFMVEWFEEDDKKNEKYGLFN